jgi:hypothetical protein
MTRHLTLEEIIAAADAVPRGGIPPECESHLRACGACRREVEFQQALYSAAEVSVAVRVRHEFTEDVLRQLGLSPRPALFRRLLDNAGSFLALGTVTGLVGIIVSAIQTAGMRGSQAAPSMTGSALAGARSLFSTLAESLRPFLPFSAPTVPSDYYPLFYALTGAILVLLAMDGLFDRLLGRSR